MSKISFWYLVLSTVYICFHKRDLTYVKSKIFINILHTFIYSYLNMFQRFYYNTIDRVGAELTLIPTLLKVMPDILHRHLNVGKINTD